LRSRTRKPEELVHGVHAFIGATQTGKTTEAVAVAQLIARARRRPLLAIDPAHTRALAHLTPVENYEQAVHRLYSAGLCCRWSPDRDVEEAEPFFRFARRPGGLVVLVDECSWFAQSRPLLQLCRTWAHSGTTVVLTGQDLMNDLGSKLRSCGILLRVFRMPYGPGLAWLARYYRVNAESIHTQPVGAYQVMRL
jgi:hypothetical protein